MSPDRNNDRNHERPHLSIGEVLSLLQDEFPDITISKIRFLESQGLLDPERTPSGYRKFYDHDLARLRWILTQQRDHFLPLRVIKERLDAGVVPDGTAMPPSTPSPSTASAPEPTAPEPASTEPASAESASVESASGETGATAGGSAGAAAPAATAGTGAAPGRLAPVGGGPARVVGGTASGDARRADGDDEGGGEAPVEASTASGADAASASGTRGSDGTASGRSRGRPAARPGAGRADTGRATDHNGIGRAASEAERPATAVPRRAARGGAGAEGDGDGDEAAGPGTAGPDRASVSGGESSGRRSTWRGPTEDRSDAAESPAPPGPSEPGPAGDATETGRGGRPAATPGTPAAPAARSDDREGGAESAESRRRRPADVTALSMSLTELAAACGQSVADLHELERFGLISGEHVGSSVVYRDDALLIARLAARFGRHGIEPRHLRQYRVAAEREVALVEQVIAPFLLSRGRAGAAGEAAMSGRRSAFETADELAGLGDELRQVLVERGLRSYLDGV